MFFENQMVGTDGLAARAAQRTHSAMGTVMTHKAFGRRAGECLDAVVAEVDRLESSLSRFLPESDVSRVNRSAGVGCEAVSFDTWEVLAQAVDFSGRCEDCFTVTIGPLVDLWRRGKTTAAPPEEAALRQALGLVNDHDLALDPSRGTAGLKRAGQSIDLGGIGKGFAGDRILEVYREYGIDSACSNFGGNVVTLGARPDGAPWQIGIQHPRAEDKILGSVAVVNQSVVTSGDYQRYFIDRQGKRRHHILDPRTGYPAEAGLISVSIVAEQSLAADALSTALFVAGLERGLALLRRFPQTGAILVDTNLQVYVTQGLRHRFQADRGIGVTIIDG